MCRHASFLSIVGSESAGKPWRSVARRDDARTGASSGYSRLAPAIETRGGGGGFLRVLLLTLQPELFTLNGLSYQKEQS